MRPPARQLFCHRLRVGYSPPGHPKPMHACLPQQALWHCRHHCWLLPRVRHACMHVVAIGPSRWPGCPSSGVPTANLHACMLPWAPCPMMACLQSKCPCMPAETLGPANPHGAGQQGEPPGQTRPLGRCACTPAEGLGAKTMAGSMGPLGDPRGHWGHRGASLEPRGFPIDGCCRPHHFSMGLPGFHRKWPHPHGPTLMEQVPERSQVQISIA